MVWQKIDDLPTGPNGDLLDPSVVRVGYSFKVNWAFLNEWPACYVYQVFDKNHRVIYVGITNDFGARWTAHLAKSWWATSIDIDCILLTGYLSRFHARVIEALLIDELQPPCNVKQERKYLGIGADIVRPDDVLTAELEPRRAI